VADSEIECIVEQTVRSRKSTGSTFYRFNGPKLCGCGNV
jgi:hypothetical protein